VTTNDPTAGQIGPFTRVGIAVVVLGAVSYVVGWQLGWIELMVLAAGCLLALLVAIPFVVGTPAIDLLRRLEPERVTVGEPAVAEMTATNTRNRRARRLRVEEHVGDSTVAIEVPSLAPGDEHSTMYALPTRDRGIFQVGPAVVTRADPLGLLRRVATHTKADTLWVYPRWALLEPLPVGFAKDLEGPTSDASPAGDVAFHAIRPYQYGDDPRHIHWMSTARTGSVMVRHYVDNRRPNLGVLFDTDPAAYDDDRFETAVEIVTSMMLSSLAAQLPITAVTSASWLLGRLKPGDRDTILERLTVVQPESGPHLVEVASHALRHEPGTSAVAIVTGDREPIDLLRCAALVRRHARPIVISVKTDASTPVPIPGARHFGVASLDEFQAAWNGSLL